MCCHLAIVRKVKSTSGMSDGCGLLYRPTSENAVTSLKPPLGFFTRKDGFRYSVTTPTFSGLLNTPFLEFT